MTGQHHASSRTSRSASFVGKFGSCEAHRREARAVHEALEQMVKQPLAGLDPEAVLGDVLPAEWVSRLQRPPSAIGSDAHPTTLAQVLSKQAVVSDALHTYLTQRLRTTLLGPAAAASTWDAGTLPARSVRGLVDERVRHSGGCACV